LRKSQSELLAYLFDAHHSAFSAQVTHWIVNSPRFASFATEFKDKIRKKIRVTRGSTAETDLLYELQIANWLLQEKRFELAYEPFASGKTRGPDFSVTLRSNFTFNIEVTHVRKLTTSQVGETLLDLRLIDVICGKLRQMTPNRANLVFIVSSASLFSSLDLPAHVAWIKDMAERKDDQFYARHRFANPSEFFKFFKRLSGVALYAPNNTQLLSLWLNPQAKIALADPVRNILQRGPVLKALRKTVLN